MAKGPDPTTLFIRIGAAVWVVVTLAGAVIVIQAPAEHADLGLFLVLVWVAFIGFVALGRVYEWLSWRLR